MVKLQLYDEIGVMTHVWLTAVLQMIKTTTKQNTICHCYLSVLFLSVDFCVGNSQVIVELEETTGYSPGNSIMLVSQITLHSSTSLSDDAILLWRPWISPWPSRANDQLQTRPPWREMEGIHYGAQGHFSRVDILSVGIISQALILKGSVSDCYIYTFLAVLLSQRTLLSLHSHAHLTQGEQENPEINIVISNK